MSEERKDEDTPDEFWATKYGPDTEAYEAQEYMKAMDEQRKRADQWR